MVSLTSKLIIIVISTMIMSMNTIGAELNSITNGTHFRCAVEDTPVDKTDVGPESRQSVSRNITIEIGLFYDKSFADRHGTDAMNMMKIVMHQTQLILQYPSMTIPIRLVVTRITRIGNRHIPNTYPDHLIDPYSEWFCEWQYLNYWNRTRDYDLAILFSDLLFQS